MTINISKAPELLLAGEVLALFNSDVLLPSKAKSTPFPLLEELLAEYCAYLGVRTPSSKQLGAFLTSKYPKQTLPGYTAYLVGINPAVIKTRDTHDTDQ